MSSSDTQPTRDERRSAQQAQREAAQAAAARRDAVVWRIVQLAGSLVLIAAAILVALMLIG